MPLYTFVRIDDEAMTTDMFYRMAEAPRVGSQITDDQGITWRRVWTVPNASISNGSQSDPYSASDFKARTDNKKLTMGDMFDMSKEASDKRASKDGVDPIKQKYFKDYKKTRKGMEHSAEKRERFEKVQSDLGISIKGV